MQEKTEKIVYSKSRYNYEILDYIDYITPKGWHKAKREIAFNELNKCNSYNTRSNCFTGLPVGPICNPGLESLKATFEPSDHNNYYFVADCNGKTYLSKDASTHSKTINDLKNKGLWCEK